MKRLLLIILLLCVFQSFSQYEIFLENGKFGLKKGNKVTLKAQYQMINSVREKGFVVMKSNKQGILDSTLKTILPLEYDLIIETELKKGISFSLKKINFGEQLIQKVILLSL